MQEEGKGTQRPSACKLGLRPMPAAFSGYTDRKVAAGMPRNAGCDRVRAGDRARRSSPTYSVHKGNRIMTLQLSQ